MSKFNIRIHPDYKNNPLLQRFINNLPAIFTLQGSVLYDERNIIKSFVLDESDNILQHIIVKRYKRPTVIQRIVYSFFRSSKAKRAYLNAAEFIKRGIDTPSGIAYIEQYKNGLFEFGYYISGSDFAPPIREKLIEQEEFDLIMAKDFAAFAAELHEKGILHHDLNSTNVLYHPHNGQYRFSVIDINRVKFFPKGSQLSKNNCFDNLTRFTGRMDLFEYVLKQYVEIRNWNPTTLSEAIEIKKNHDKQWRRRKAFFKKLSGKK